MKKIIAEGLHKIYNTYGTLKAEVRWELTQREQRTEFWASGSFPEQGYGDILDDLARVFPMDKRLKDIYRVWRRYNRAGLPSQEKAISECIQELRSYTYRDTCIWLKAKGLYALPLPKGTKCMKEGQTQLEDLTFIQEEGEFPEGVAEGRCKFKYGQRWILLAEDPAVIEEIKSW